MIDVSPADKFAAKARQAPRKFSILQECGLTNKNQRLLDVGCQRGALVGLLRGKGYAVTGVELDGDSFNFGVENNTLDPQRDYNMGVEALPSSLNGTFDIVSIFLFAIPWNIRDQVFKRIAQLLKPTGLLIIGTEAHFYVGPDDSLSLEPPLKKYFSHTRKYWLPSDNEDPQKYLMVCQGPGEKLTLRDDQIRRPGYSLIKGNLRQIEQEQATGLKRHVSSYQEYSSIRPPKYKVIIPYTVCRQSHDKRDQDHDPSSSGSLVTSVLGGASVDSQKDAMAGSCFMVNGERHNANHWRSRLYHRFSTIIPKTIRRGMANYHFNNVPLSLFFPESNTSVKPNDVNYSNTSTPSLKS